VDDPYFWPAARDSPGPGVNVWVALDAVTAAGGGLAVARGSHTDAFLDCRKAIERGTCSMAILDPANNRRLEALADVPEMHPGDAIVHTRWLFHRTNGFAPGAVAASRRGIARCGRLPAALGAPPMPRTRADAPRRAATPARLERALCGDPSGASSALMPSSTCRMDFPFARH